MEKSYLMIKPGCEGYEEEILKMLEPTGMKILKRKEMILTPELLREHYAHIVSKKEVYPTLEKYMLSGKVVAFVVEGTEGVIERIRKVVGPTKASILKYEDPEIAKTIRGKYAKNVTENVIHASDSVESAQAEIKRFFGSEKTEDVQQ